MGLAFFIGSFLSRSAQAVTVGFGEFEISVREQKRDLTHIDSESWADEEQVNAMQTNK